MLEIISNYSRIDKIKSFLIALLFILPFLLFILAYPNDAMGWILLASSYAILIMAKEIRNSRVVFPVSVVVLTIHNTISFLNAYVGTTIGADADAIGFNNAAETLADVGSKFQLQVGSGFYSQFLASVYKLFGVSHFTGEMTSGFAFAISLIVLMKLMGKMEIKKHQGKLLFLFGALPTVIFETSVTLRESWEILFFLLSVYSALQLRDKKSLFNFLILIGSVGILAMWHNGLMAFAPLFIALSLWWSFSKNKRQRGVFGKKILILSAMALVGVLWIYTAKGWISSAASDALLNGNATDYVNQYRSGSMLDSRATYGVSVSDSSLFGLIKTLPLMFFYYMFSPLPWQIGNMMDIYAAGESFLRYLLFYYAFKSWKSKTGEDKSRHGFIFLVFLSLELLWSMGTSNWGTAIRHHIIGYGLLLLLGAPMMFTKKLKSGKTIIS